MDDRAWIATRKGLFELRRRRPAGRCEKSHFLGEPVSMLLPPEGSGRMLAALNLGHFGVKLHGSDDAGASWQELAAPAYPEQPAERARAGLEALADLVARRARRHDLGRHPPGRAVPLRRPRRVLAAGRFALEPARAPRMVRRRLRRAGHPFDLPAPRQRSRAAARHQLRRRLGHPRRRRQLDAAGRRHARRLHAAGAGRQSERPGSARDRPLRRRPVGALGPASQRHLPLDRQRRELARDHERAAVELRLRRRHAIPRDADMRVVRARRRRPAAACRSARALAVNRTRDGGRASRPCAPACRRPTATTSSTATAWRSMPAAGGS